MHNYSEATRNTDDFEACGLELINPFEFMAAGLMSDGKERSEVEM